MAVQTHPDTRQESDTTELSGQTRLHRGIRRDPSQLPGKRCQTLKWDEQRKAGMDKKPRTRKRSSSNERSEKWFTSQFSGEAHILDRTKEEGTAPQRWRSNKRTSAKFSWTKPLINIVRKFFPTVPLTEPVSKLLRSRATEGSRKRDFSFVDCHCDSSFASDHNINTLALKEIKRTAEQITDYTKAAERHGWFATWRDPLPVVSITTPETRGKSVCKAQFHCHSR